MFKCYNRLINLEIEEYDMNKFKTNFTGVFYFVLWMFIFSILSYAIILKFYNVIAYNIPREFREMTTVKFALDFSNGSNPYALSLLEQDQPFPTTMYGFLVPLILSPFVKLSALFHVGSALQVCEIVTLCVELLGILFFYLTVQRKLHSHTLSILGSLFLYACFWRYSPIGGAFPDQFGVTLSVFLLFLLTQDEQKRKYHPIAYSLILIILFYIKQYFLFLALGLFFYLWLSDSIKTALKFALSGILCGSISLFFVHVIFPLYFTEILPIAQGQTTANDFLYSFMQVIRLTGKSFLPVFLAMVSAIIMAVFLSIKTGEFHMDGFCSIKPGTKWKISYELFQVFCMFPLVFYISQNDGTIYTYYLQLWIPYVILSGIMAIHYFLAVCQDKVPNWNYVYGILPPLFLLSVFFTRKWTISPVPDTTEIENWNTAYQILEKYSEEDGNILVSPHLANFCLENGIYTAEYGQAVFNSLENYENWDSHLIWHDFFPYAGDIIMKNLDYNAKVLEGISQGRFSCIAITRTANYELPFDTLTDSVGNCPYDLLTTLTLSTGTQEWETYFYIRK